MNEPYKMLIKNPNSGKGHYYIYCSIQNYSTLKEPKKKKIKDVQDTLVTPVTERKTKQKNERS